MIVIIFAIIACCLDPLSTYEARRGNRAHIKQIPNSFQVIACACLLQVSVFSRRPLIRSLSSYVVERRVHHKSSGQETKKDASALHRLELIHCEFLTF